MTLFLDGELRRQLQSVEEDVARNVINTIKENMNNGTLDDAHDAIVNIGFMDMGDSKIIVDDAESLIDSPIVERSLMASITWLLIATGGIVLTGLGGIVKYRLCNRRENSRGLNNDDSVHSSNDSSLLLDRSQETSYDNTSILDINYGYESSENGTGTSSHISSVDGSIIYSDVDESLLLAFD